MIRRQPIAIVAVAAAAFAVAGCGGSSGSGAQVTVKANCPGGTVTVRVLKAKVSGGDNNWHVAVHYAVYCNEAPVPADVVVEIGSGLKRTFSAPSGAATAQIGGLTADPTGGTVTVTAVDQAGNEHSESHKIEP